MRGFTVGRRYVEAHKATVRVLSEAELAAWRRQGGAKTVHSRGRFWVQTSPGFYQGVHYLARMSASEAERPAPICWAYRTSLRDGDAWQANASMPLWLLEDLESYDENALVGWACESLAGCRRKVEIVGLRDMALLRQQGYEVYESHARRHGAGEILSRTEYLFRINTSVFDDRRLILAGLVEGRLAGYADSFAVEGHAYLCNTFVASEFLSTNISTGLRFEGAQAYRRSGAVRTVADGFDMPEQKDVMAFKTRLNFKVVPVPARIGMLAPARAILRARRPWAYYRMTGKLGALVGDRGEAAI